MKHTIFTYVQLFSRQLEESLELMSSEFESMEDYWQQKLDSERSFGEEQLKSSESQFRELEARLREYEDLLVAAEASDSEHKSGVLSTIEEDRDLEEKVRSASAAAGAFSQRRMQCGQVARVLGAKS